MDRNELEQFLERNDTGARTKRKLLNAFDAEHGTPSAPATPAKGRGHGSAMQDATPAAEF